MTSPLGNFEHCLPLYTTQNDPSWQTNDLSLYQHQKTYHQVIQTNVGFMRNEGNENFLTRIAFTSRVALNGMMKAKRISFDISWALEGGEELQLDTGCRSLVGMRSMQSTVQVSDKPEDVYIIWSNWCGGAQL